MLFSVLWLVAPACLILQVVVTWRSSEGEPLAAGVPMSIVLPVLVYTVMGLIQQRNS